LLGRLFAGKGIAKGIPNLASDLFESLARQATFFSGIHQAFAGLRSGFLQMITSFFRGVHQSLAGWPKRSLLNFGRGKSSRNGRPSDKTNKRDRQGLLLKNLLRG
jgi:hypothetical protein